MLNRFKLLVLAIVLTLLTILFIQNQEPLSLKFFCSDTSSDYCFYQTPSLSLAIWMAIFLLLGIISSLVWQLLNSVGRTTNSDHGYSKSPQNRTSYREQTNLRRESNLETSNRLASENINRNNPPLSDWEQTNSEDWEQTRTLPNFTKSNQPTLRQQDNKTVEYKNPNETNKTNQSNKRAPAKSESRQDRFSKESSKSENVQTPRVQNTEEVYDANYRTLNNVQPPSIPEDQLTEDEDPDWI